MASAMSTCDQPHDYEITGSVNVSQLKALPANNQQWQNALGAQCEQQTRAYTGSSVSQGRTGGWIPIEQSSWDAGRRVAECIVAKYNADGSDQLTTGSAKITKPA
jgi:hypothetical protein